MSEDDKTVETPVETPVVETDKPVETPAVVTPEERYTASKEALKKFVATERPNLNGEEQKVDIDLTPETEEKPEDKKPKVEDKPKETPKEEPVVETPVDTEVNPLQEELDTLKGKNKSLNDDLANNMNLLNHAAKHKPEIYHKFLAEIAGSVMESKGLPGITPQEKPVEAPQSHLVDQINPATDEVYTTEEISAFEKNFAAVANRMGLVKQTDLDAKDAQAEVKKAQKTAVKNINDFKDTWSEKTAKMGLDWDTQVEPAMSAVLGRWGIGQGDFGKITPETLSDAFNTMMMGQPEGMSMMMESAKADALKEDKRKRTTGKVIPTKSSKPVGDKGAETFLEQFKKVDLKEKRRIAGKLIEQFNKEKGIDNPIA